MRTTIDLPQDLHDAAKSIAHDRGQTLSQAVADIMRLGLGQRRTTMEVGYSEVTGLPVVSFGGRTFTHEDVRSLEDDE